MNLTNPLDEAFDESTGALPTVYSTTDLTGLIFPFSTVSGTHRDIRTFNANTNIYRTTVADLSWNNLGYLGGSGTAHSFTVGQLQNSYVSGHPWPTTENWIVQKFGQPERQLVLTKAFQTFTPSGVAATVIAKVGPSASYSFSSALTATFSGSLPTIAFVSPSGTVDMLSGFEDPTTEYDVIFKIRNVPPQTDPLHFNLGSSSISFSDTSGNQSSVPFSTFSNLLSVSSTADVPVRFNRNLLTGINLRAINDVQIRIALTGSGSFTSHFQGLRVIPSGTYNEPYYLINTQSKRLAANINTAIPTNPITLLFNQARPKNFQQNIRFNTGSYLAPGSGTNYLSTYYRYNQPSSYIVGVFSMNGTTASMTLTQSVSGSLNSIGGSFTVTTVSGSTDYILSTTVVDNYIKASLYDVSGAYFGRQLATTGFRILPRNVTARGYVGFVLTPTNYDFQVAEVSMQRAEFGTMTTSPAHSFKPVKATQLYTNTSGPTTLLNMTNITSYGDATLTINQNAGDPIPDYLLTRAGTNTPNVTPTSNWSGGVVSSGTFNIHDPNELYLAGSIYPYVTGAATSTTYSGTFQVGLLSKDNQVGYVATIPNIVGGQWNSFVLPLNPNVVSGKYYIVIRNTGYYAQRFEVDNISLYHNTVSWSAANDGQNFIPFYDNINNQYSMLTFPAQHPQIQLKAAALSDSNAWIESWIDKPIYQE